MSASSRIKRREYNRHWMQRYREKQRNIHLESEQTAQTVSVFQDSILLETIPNSTAGANTDNQLPSNIPDSHSGTGGPLHNEQVAACENHQLVPVDSGNWKFSDATDSPACQDETFSSVGDTFTKGSSGISDYLRTWSLAHNINHSALDGLLKVLRQSGHHELPKTAKTLLRTQKERTNIQTIADMEYVYYGIENHLQTLAAEVSHSQCFKLAINIDGLPLFKSSSTSFWLVLGHVTNIDSAPVFPILITMGKTKPKGLTFLSDLVTELKRITENGVDTNFGKLPVSVAYIVCDAPAKAMVKGTKLYSGYYGCFDCDIRGQYMHQRMLYPEYEHLTRRTDESFRAQSNKEHHTCTSPFVELSIDMIKCFPIDYMHSCLLGVMKKLLVTWFSDTKGQHRLASSQITLVNRRLDGLKNQLPSDFSRKPRTTSELCRWKATEFRTFLVYTGKLVLKEVLSTEMYNHFLALSVALEILLVPALLSEYKEFARELLIYFVANCATIYGEKFMVYNIHSLLHLVDQSEIFGALDSCSAFRFENYMQSVKRCIRHGSSPLAQISKRLSERKSVQQCQPSSCVTKKLTLRKRDNTYFTKDGKVVELVRVRYRERTDQGAVRTYTAREYLNPSNLFTVPCASKLLDIYLVDKNRTCLIDIPDTRVGSRCAKMECEGKIVVQRLQHH